MTKKTNAISWMIILAFVTSCGTQIVAIQHVPDATEEMPPASISRHPQPADFSGYYSELTSIPKFDPTSTDLWQIDLRSRDLMKIDMRN